MNFILPLFPFNKRAISRKELADGNLMFLCLKLGTLIKFLIKVHGDVIEAILIGFNSHQQDIDRTNERRRHEVESKGFGPLIMYYISRPRSFCRFLFGLNSISA